RSGTRGPRGAVAGAGLLLAAGQVLPLERRRAQRLVGGPVDRLETAADGGAAVAAGRAGTARLRAVGVGGADLHPRILHQRLPGAPQARARRAAVGRRRGRLPGVLGAERDLARAALLAR